MQLPTKLSHTLHKHGGRITEITKISHRIEKPWRGRSRDTYFFVGDVEWSDGSKSHALGIMPYDVCCDCDEHAEVNALMGLLNDYLLANGERYDTGKHKGWYAHRGTAKAENNR